MDATLKRINRARRKNTAYIFLIVLSTIILYSSKSLFPRFYIAINCFTIIFALLVIVLIILFNLSVTLILLNECDPETYYIVTQNVSPKWYYNIIKEVVEYNTAFYLGDFRSALQITAKNQDSKKISEQKNSFFEMGLCAYFLGDNNLMKYSIQRLSELNETSEKKNGQTLEMIDKLNLFYAVANQNIDELPQLLNNVKKYDDVKVCKLHKAFYSLISAKAYELLEMPDEAKKEYEFVKANGNKTFMTSLANEYLDKN